MRRAVLLMCIAFAAPAAHGQAPEPKSADTVEVIGTTPVPGMGVARDQLPANVQVFHGSALRAGEPLSLPDLIGRSAAGASASDIQGNPFQPDVSFRGFAASPLLGTPQGLSVYQDGVRINAPFGDVVHWDLLPLRALESVTIAPGSNPLYGLNTLGGAFALRTKSGDRNPGGELEFSAGSFGRKEAGFEFGRRLGGGAHGYVAATLFDEDGWRDFAPSRVGQLFAKLGRRSEAFDVDLALTLADTRLTGNGLVPQSILERSRKAIFTHPDRTQNRLIAPALNLRWLASNETQWTALLYLRRLTTRTLNGDINDQFEDGPNDLAGGGTGLNIGTAVHNRTLSAQTAAGAALQWTRASAENRLALGATHDRGRSRFEQTAQTGIFDATRGVAPTDPEALENALRGTTRTTSVYLTDTLSLRPDFHLTASARYNLTQVRLRDTGPGLPALDGDHRFAKLNPALGFAWQALERLTLYGGYAQGNRAPTPIELGCADPLRPCTLPNALAADPPLNQVVARTLEAGVRGRLPGGARWNAGVFRTDNRDDILFVGTTTSAGFFRNFGKTRREGLELGTSGERGSVQWRASYSLVRATYRSGACIVSENNSSRGTSSACSPSDGMGGFLGNDLIEVRSGERIPDIPLHSVKLALEAPLGSKLRIGADLQAYSSRFVRGNENNRHQAGNAQDLNGDVRTFLGPGTVPGHAILNLNARLDAGGGWEVIAKLTNLFDRRYATGGALAENPFDPAGTFRTDSDTWTRETFVAPGAPRAGWIALRYRFLP